MNVRRLVYEGPVVGWNEDDEREFDGVEVAKEMLGQERIKKQLFMAIEAAKGRGGYDHVLLHGPLAERRLLLM